jgi:hypothetical protein
MPHQLVLISGGDRGEQLIKTLYPWSLFWWWTSLIGPPFQKTPTLRYFKNRMCPHGWWGLALWQPSSHVSKWLREVSFHKTSLKSTWMCLVSTLLKWF